MGKVALGVAGRADHSQKATVAELWLTPWERRCGRKRSMPIGVTPNGVALIRKALKTSTWTGGLLGIRGPMRRMTASIQRVSRVEYLPTCVEYPL